ncbi:flagellar brake protein [Massilia sp. TS11]|uniref:flagellar brake protein n=1 Tax=Massilia sp. TS11 TaxID=2908003 RepID=UPI001EDC4426|nr:flagellar brake protein [Massilia sp. TS11]MCG2586442.1 flagellar brake protein [Massilia sp. TS11]
MSKPSPEAQPQPFEFDAMNLQVGGRLQFLTHRTIKPVQYFSSLIGYVRDEYLIVKTPFENGAPIGLNEGEKLTIRVFTGVNVCSFTCTVLRAFPRPINYVHLSFPDQIQGTSLRAAVRVKVDIPAQVTGSRAFATCNVFIVNLSVSGALIESPRKLSELDKQINLSFTLLTQPGNLQVRVTTKAAVRNAGVVEDRPDSEPIYTYGVQFLGLEPSHYTLLQNLTYEALISDRAKIV